MPILALAFRQRERVIERVWAPIQPEFYTAVYGGQYFAKTFAKQTIVINTAIPVVDMVPFGFFFMPVPNPPFKNITQAGGIESDPLQASLAIGVLPTLSIAGIPAINMPGTITPAQATALAAGAPLAAAPLLRIITFSLTPGIIAINLTKTSTLVRRVTILASSSNTGIIWVNSGQGQAAGIGFPLVSGAAKDYGDPSMIDKQIDISNIYIIGTVPGDTVYISAEA